MNFHERLKFLREKKGITQKDMAEILDISKSAYIKYERGEREPKYGTLVALSEIFNVSVDYLIGKTDIENKDKERINDIYDFISSDEFKLAQGKKLDSVLKLISEFMQVIYLLEDTDMLDLLYTLTCIEKKAINLYQLGRHISLYEEWAKNDIEYENAVDKPNVDDLSEFISSTVEIRNLLDNYLYLISSKKYFENMTNYYEKEINEYSYININDLQTKFHNDLRYKTL